MLNKPRNVALQVLVQVIQHGRSLSQIGDEQFDLIKDGRDRALAKQLVFGVLRHYFRLAFLISRLVKKPLKSKDTDITVILMLGLYQLTDMRIPAYAAINDMVELAKTQKKQWATRFVNGVLREFQRHQDEYLNQCEQDEAARVSHPLWLIKKLRVDWPDEWETICWANNSQGPMTIRVNVAKYTREAYQEKLASLAMHSNPCRQSPVGLTLSKPVDVSTLPEFESGACTVQDEAAQFAALLLDLHGAKHVLDACAAPGGKSSHIQEVLNPGSRLIALEVDEKRKERLQANLARFENQLVTVVHGDATQSNQWWSGEPFDRILLDAPCTGSGVIRRNPDIKLLRLESDTDQFVQQQRVLLHALWPLLNKGGVLVYATCSIFPEENARQIEAFTQATDDAFLDKLSVDWGIDTGFGRQILTGVDGMDGFFYARLRKG